MNNVLPEGWRGSTNLNHTIKTYGDLAYRAKAHFGYPATEVELTDEQIAIFIDTAVEWYSRYAGYTNEYIVWCDNLYEPNRGVKLDDLFDVGINTNNNYVTEITSEVVTATDIDYTVLSTASAYLSVTPFYYPNTFDVGDIQSETDSNIGQKISISFDPLNPWDTNTICDANCVRIIPKGFDYETLSANDGLQDLEFNFGELVTVYPELEDIDFSSYGIELTASYSITAVPVDVLRGIGIDYFPLSAFYDENTLVGATVDGGIAISDGKGYVTPTCDLDDIDKCDPLSAQWGNGVDVSSATHINIVGFPVCVLDSTIALDSNNGIASTFTLCNSAVDTEGCMEVNNIQFLIDHKPPVEILYDDICEIDNKGLKITKNITEIDYCVKATPNRVPVDVQFVRKDITEYMGTITESFSSQQDNDLMDRRKVVGVFEIQAGNRFGFGGGFGSAGLLFNFDFMIMANVFGFDLQGNRSGAMRNGYDLVTYHQATSFIQHAQKMLRYVSYEFNPDTQYLRIIPEPKYNASTPTNFQNRRCYILGAYVEKPISHMITKKWVERYVIAQMKETLGLLRSKFGQVVLFGGSTISGDSLVSMGREDREKLEMEIREGRYESAPPMFFMR